ncbi:MAG: AmmeMemoRadiSam system protein B [Elusimicrobia bacterium]|nr:AmmeMemoRadiSam system protein B [Elusimicrobiota bacterium]
MPSPPEGETASPLPAMRRDVEAVPIEHEGSPMFLLQDSEGISPEPIAVSPTAMLVASLLNGKSTAAELQAAFTKATGTVLGLGEISSLVSELGRMNYLETSEVAERRKAIWEGFLKSPARPAVLSGSAYPKEGLELAQALGKFFVDPKGPGKPLADKPALPRAPLGLVSPHIDLDRGGPSYAWAYGALSEAPPPDLIVALGVAHASPNSPWILTRKSYETPYGSLDTSLELFQDVQDLLWYDACADEWAHRREHSLEFQALWLKYLWREKTPPWVPILVSSFERFAPDRAPSGVETVETALRRIGERLAERGKKQRIMILAGVDLAHVGPRFGDDVEVNAELKLRVEAADRETLEQALKLDADAFYLSAVAGGHWRKICGLSALYTGLRWIKALGGEGPGKLLSYGQAPDPAGGLVSFASAIFP